jgi:hypothetical protein
MSGATRKMSGAGACPPGKMRSGVGPGAGIEANDFNLDERPGVCYGRGQASSTSSIRVEDRRNGRAELELCTGRLSAFEVGSCGLHALCT